MQPPSDQKTHSKDSCMICNSDDFKGGVFLKVVMHIVFKFDIS